MDKVKKGQWVEVKNILLYPEERAARLPDDTKKVPYEMRVRGFLIADAYFNEKVEIKTLIGRIMEGELIRKDPGYTHGYGLPINELLYIGTEEQRILNK